jgi:hypothetical protein
VEAEHVAAAPIEVTRRGGANGENHNASLKVAKKRGFTVVNIKNDWKTVFRRERTAAAK